MMTYDNIKLQPIGSTIHASCIHSSSQPSKVPPLIGYTVVHPHLFPTKYHNKEKEYLSTRKNWIVVARLSHIRSCFSCVSYNCQCLFQWISFRDKLHESQTSLENHGSFRFSDFPVQFSKRLHTFWKSMEVYCFFLSIFPWIFPTTN